MNLLKQDSVKTKNFKGSWAAALGVVAAFSVWTFLVPEPP